MESFLSAVAKSSASLKNHVATMASAFLSFLIALSKWPDPWRYMMALIVGIIFLLIFRSWTWNIFSLELDEISRDRVPKKKRHPGDPAFHPYTYSQMFTRRHIMFNVVLMVLILIGQYLTS